MDDTSCGETTITYDNAPGYWAIAGSSSPLTAGTWVVVDVTSLVTAMNLASRQSGANAQQLIIEKN